MTEQPIEVDVQIVREDIPAGRLWTHRHGRSESATFSYREDHLQRADAYAPAFEHEQSAAARKLLAT